MSTPGGTRVGIESPRQPEIAELLDLSTRFATALYPPESNFLLSIDELESPQVSFYVARGDAGGAAGSATRALGIVALVPAGDGTAELKRMFVHPDARGQGIATLLIESVEADARADGIRRLVLETGPLHTAAIALYERHGYRSIPPFGQYVGEEFSLCFSKLLSLS